MILQKRLFLLWLGLSIFTMNAAAQQPRPTPTVNPVEIENAQTGTRDWQIPDSRGATNREIEGYPSATSVNIGDTIQFYVNVATQQTVNIDVYRMGFYGGLGGRYITTKTGTATPQTLPDADYTTGLIECNWTANPAFSWTVPTTAVSGVYIAKLVGTARDSYIVFIVRDDARTSDIITQIAVTTYQAYNIYPGFIATGSWKNGKSLYTGFDPKVPLDAADEYKSFEAREVSFNRPYYPDNGNIYNSAGQFFVWEYHMVRWLEKQGFDVTYITDVDAHSNAANFSSGKHKVFLNSGHDEYWTWEMRSNLTAARDRSNFPMHLAFLGSNDCYWQIRLEPSVNNPQNLYSTIVSYKTHTTDPFPSGDPVLTENSDPSDDYKQTRRWRENTYSYPEDELMGLMTDTNFVEGYGNFTLHSDRPSWLTENISQTVFTDLVGYEPAKIAAAFGNNYPNRTTANKVAESQATYTPVNGPTQTGTVHAVFYQMNINNTPRGKVFAVGTNFWAWGLDPFPIDPQDDNYRRHPFWKQSMYDADIEEITLRLLECYIYGSGCEGEA